MSSSSFTDKTNKGSKANKLFAALAAVVVLGVGYGLVNTRAAGPFATLEAASVNPTSPAQLVTDSSLPGGKALQFGPTVTLPPPPEPPDYWWEAHICQYRSTSWHKIDHCEWYTDILQR